MEQKRIGRPPKGKDKKKFIGIKLKPNLCREIERLATLRKTSKTAVIEGILENAI